MKELPPHTPEDNTPHNKRPTLIPHEVHAHTSVHPVSPHSTKSYETRKSLPIMPIDVSYDAVRSDVHIPDLLRAIG